MQSVFEFKIKIDSYVLFNSKLYLARKLLEVFGILGGNGSN